MLPVLRLTCALTSVILILGILGCSKSLNRAEAERLIVKSTAFQDVSADDDCVMSLRQKWYQGEGTIENFEREMQKAGYIQIGEEKFTNGPDIRYTVCTITGFTEKGKIFEKDWNGQVYCVPIMKRELVKMTGLLIEQKSATAEFSWRIIPNDLTKELVKVGYSAPTDSGLYNGIAVIKQFDDGWRVTEIKLQNNNQRLTPFIYSIF